MYEFKEGDYIEFKRIVSPAKKHGFIRGENGRAVATPEIPEQVLAQSGDGQILKLAKNPRKVQGQDKSFTVARVTSHVGVVTAILDDAELKAMPLTMDFGIEHVDPAVTRNSMYGTDSRHA